MIISLLVTFIAVLVSTAQAREDAMHLFKKGNEAFRAGDYKASLESYTSVVEGGFESADLYFNMGNACFKLGENASAILYYEKALRLSPDDEAIKTNLTIANLKTTDKVEGAPELPFTSWWTSLLNLNTIDEWAYWSLALAYAGLAILLLYLFIPGAIRKLSFFAALFLFAGSILFYLLGAQSKSRQLNSRFGIIFSPTVTVRSAPGHDATRLFVIHEGTKIEILGKEGEWTEISLMNGNKGWLMEGDYKTI